MKRLMTILARQILFVRPLKKKKKWGKLDESLPNMQSMLLFSIRKVKYFEIRFWFLTDFWPKRKKIPCKTQDQNQTNKLIKLLKSEHGISYKLEFYHDLLERLLQNSFKFSLRTIMLSALDNDVVRYTPWIMHSYFLLISFPVGKDSVISKGIFKEMDKINTLVFST